MFPLLQEQGILVLNKAVEACTLSIEQHKGKLVVKEAARAVSVNPSYIWFRISLTFGVHCIALHCIAEFNFITNLLI